LNQRLFSFSRYVPFDDRVQMATLIVSVAAALGSVTLSFPCSKSLSKSMPAKLALEMLCRGVRIKRVQRTAEKAAEPQVKEAGS